MRLKAGSSFPLLIRQDDGPRTKVVLTGNKWQRTTNKVRIPVVGARENVLSPGFPPLFQLLFYLPNLIGKHEDANTARRVGINTRTSRNNKPLPKMFVLGCGPQLPQQEHPPSTTHCHPSPTTHHPPPSPPTERPTKAIHNLRVLLQVAPQLFIVGAGQIYSGI